MVQSRSNDVVFAQQGYDAMPKAGSLADLHHQEVEDGERVVDFGVNGRHIRLREPVTSVAPLVGKHRLHGDVP